MLKDEELYKGFKPEEFEPMRQEVRNRWGAEKLRVVEERIKELSSKEWEDHQKKG